MGDVKVTVDLKGYDRKLSKANFQKGQFTMANQMLADMTPFVPFEEGALSGSGMVESNGEILSWDTPYAKRWFFNDANFQTTFHPQATSRWDLAAQGMYGNTWPDKFVEGAGLR
ncbi:minor capsid protein [Streptococcus suis]